ncbi:MAG: ADP-glyceromanno-heptose 6-epimerase, partial [Euryarchaeota archaeon]|nr:ADP-glyceromanno-heptose 6-epimerase [Euryarchaeota archaeon]
TGGAGFIGSALVWKLNQLGEDNIIIVDSLRESEKWKNISSLNFRDYLEKDDFLSGITSRSWTDEIKAVFHLGACSSTTEQDIRYLIKNNYEYTKTLAGSCAAGGVRFIYASSAATYGDGRQGYRDDADEIDRLRPLNGYGFSKQLFDLWARREGLLDRIAGLKYFNVFGPNEYHKGDMRSMVCKGFEQIQATGRLRLFKSEDQNYADGEQERDFVYVKDAVTMTVYFYQHPDKNGLFNIGTGRAQTWNTLAAAIFAALEKPVKIDYIPLPDHLRGKYQYHTRAEIDRLRGAGCTDPFTSLKEAIRDYVQNYLLPGAYLENIN